ncbi:MAG: sigma-70 family RNA polymerase sigma factor, partial [Chloroflexi bacterium]
MVSPAIAKQFLHFQRATQSIKHSMTAQEQDLDLIRRMVSGDENAVRELYATYGQRLFAYALRLTDDRALAEDVAQETLVIAWRTAGKFRGEGRLVTWLLGIVHHSAMKALRQVSALQPLEALEETAPGINASPEEQAQMGEMKHWVRQGL